MSICGDATENVSKLHAEYINKCLDNKNLIATNIKKQEILLDEILVLNNNFNKYRENDPKMIQKNKTIQLIEQSLARFYSIFSNLNAGNTFYSNLQVFVPYNTSIVKISVIFLLREIK